MNKKTTYRRIKEEDLTTIKNTIFEIFRLCNAENIGRFTIHSMGIFYEQIPDDLYIRDGKKFVKYNGGK